jgi:hypothetical protein
MPVRRSILAILIVIIPLIIKAQEDDFNFWTVINLGKSINNWDANVELESRQSGFFDKALRYSFQPEISYRIIKHLKIGASYSLMSVYDFKYNDYQQRNRFSAFMEGRMKAERFTFRLREKWELTSKDDSDRIRLDGKIDTYKINPEQIWRNKLKISYDVPHLPLEPGIAIETFYQLNNPDGNELEKVRYSAFLAYKLDNKNTLEVFSHVNNDRMDKLTVFILGIEFSHSF